MSQSEIKTLHLQRGNIKRILTNIEQALAKVTDAKSIATFDPQARLQKLEEIWPEFDKIQSKLEALVPGEIELIDTDNPLSDFKSPARDSFEERYFFLSGLIKALVIPDTISSSETSPSVSTVAAVNSDETSIISSIKLPTINLPTFTGTYDTWLGFSDTFKAIVRDNAKIAEIQKLHYLKSCLKDEAADLIASLETSAENYEVAWNLLKDRYDNKRVIVENHTRAILQAPVMSKEFSIRALLDHIQKHSRALRALGQPVDKWDTLLILIIKDKLNPFTREKFEDTTSELEFPTMKDMLAFLQRRAQFEDTKTVQPIPKGNKHEPRNSYNSQKKSLQHSYVASQFNKPVCYLCQAEHALFACDKFLNFSIRERIDEVRKLSLCTNCLRPNHRALECKSRGCKKCTKRHNTLLHIEKQASESSAASNEPSGSVNMQSHTTSYCLVSTAVIDIFDSRNRPHSCRVLLDNGSQSHYITEKLAKLLNVQRHPVNIAVTGLNLASNTIRESISARFKSCFNNFEKSLEFLVVPHVTGTLPSTPINYASFIIPKTINLADPEFFKPAEVDSLIGVQLFYKLLCVGQFKLQGHDAVLQKTHLGWIVAGDVSQKYARLKKTTYHLTFNSQLPQIDELTRFWDIEQVPNKKFLSKEEQACETHFLQNVKRNNDGRYIVKLPFNDKKQHLGDSYKIALRRFHAFENNFRKNPALKESYSKFLDEYSDPNHMSIDQNPNSRDTGFFLPHHAVVKEDSLSTKIRVVFDGSAQDSNGISLNNALMVGPTIQDDLFSIYTRFRSFPFVLTADIEKMYRQVEVDADDCNFQKIIWHKDSTKPLSIYKLNTVTYGTAFAPFLATRVLKQLAIDEGNSHTLAAQVLDRDFYVDDLLTGAFTLQEALELRNDLLKLTKEGGLTLRKWASSNSQLIQDISEISENDLMSLNSINTIKTLGIFWNSKDDTILYTEIAKLFDPLGLLSPVIVHAKIIIQLLWKSQLTWDETVPLDIQTNWLEFSNQLPLLNNLRFDRCLIPSDTIEIQIHGFCDASERAYGACIYLRTTNKQGELEVRLTCSKSRVAPVHPVTLPRLELCAALLLSRLYAFCFQSLNHLKIQKVFFWSDSTIALHWILTSPHKLKTFVSNRVAEIQEITQSHEWKHVPTLDNPADLSSRGRMPREFLTDHIWQYGPHWLSQDESTWPNLNIQPCELPETRKSPATQTSMPLASSANELLHRYSSMRTLTHVTAFCLRFIHNARPQNIKILSKNLSHEEVQSALNRIIKLIQAAEFSKEINQIKNKAINNKNKLLLLSPFLDNGILKVGGRLKNSNIPEEQKHPILLPKTSHITDTIIREKHVELKHAGIQTTLYALRERYWVFDGRNTVRQIIRQCVKCSRVKPQEFKYVIGDLPADRSEVSRPFTNVGIDYCGPFYVKEKKFRNTKNIKSYVAIFVCLTVKAVHLELVSDLTTEAFIASLKRFFARRGKAKRIYSDNATNFVGASRELKELSYLINSDSHINEVSHYLDNEQIFWHFIPPRSPHFGGLWEAAVKSFKYHFLRSVGDAILTFEQLQTYVIEIEAVLNSRPILPLSSDPNDFRPLTPGHFLIGGPLISLSSPDLRDLKPGRLSPWQHAQQMRQHFWCRWRKEYLNEQICRSKWKSGSSSIQIGTLVLLKDDNLPPLKWALGRVIETHPGSDGIVRVVTIATSNNGRFKRCVKKVCPLLNDN